MTHFTINNRRIQLWCRSSVDTKYFTRPAAITKKTSHPKTTSYISEIKAIQPKCWRDKLNIKLPVYKLSVFTDDIFNVFYSSTKSNRRAWMSLPWNKSAAFNAKINNFTKRLSRLFESGRFNVQNVPKGKETGKETNN